jgi:hypothetical protein
LVDDVRQLLRTVVNEGRSLVRVEQVRRRDDALMRVAVVTDDVHAYERRLAAGSSGARTDLTADLIAFEQRYRAIEKSLSKDDVLVMWIEGELSGRISAFVEAAGLPPASRHEN